jgi:mRNA interferase RelE/StbE
VAWTIEYSETARKFLEKFDQSNRRRIREFLENRVAGLENPRELGKALQGDFRKYWSYRVGDMRVICNIQDQRVVVLVVAIGNRREVIDRPLGRN